MATGGDAAAGHAAEDRLLTRKEVGKKLGCSERTVYEMERHGRIPKPVKLGTWVRHRLSDIDVWIKAGCPTNPK